MFKPSCLVIFCCIFSALIGTTSVRAAEQAEEFSAWLEGLRREALSQGISAATVDRALADIAPLPRVIELDCSQPELLQTLPEYLAARVTETRVNEGKRMLRRFPTWLGRSERNYRVQRRFIVALWGIETNYGLFTGGFPVIPALATLAHDSRRSSYFRGELLTLLQLLDQGRLQLDQLEGSWAGAMGQCQFMPSSFHRFAVDADGGEVNLWASVPDVFASTANYLKQSGWKDDQTWGREVRLPKDFDVSLAGLKKRLPLSQWQTLGIRRSNGRALPRRNIEASLIMPDGADGPAYLVYDNFRVLLSWNRSEAFAVAVGTLADRLVK